MGCNCNKNKSNQQAQPANEPKPEFRTQEIKEQSLVKKICRCSKVSQQQ